MVLEKILESPLDCKEIKPVNPKGNQPRIFIGRTDAETEDPIVALPDAKIWLIRKDPGTGKVWRQVEKGMTEDMMVGWQHQWTWVWTSSRRWCSTGKPGMLQSMWWQRAEQDWADWTTKVLRTFLCFLAILVPPFVKCLNSLVLLFLLSCKNCLYSLITSILSDICYIFFFRKWIIFSDS